MNTKATYLVLALAIVVVGYFIVFETDLFDLAEPSQRQREQAGQAADPVAGKPLARFADLIADHVEALRISRPGEPTVVIRRTDDADRPWRQVEPIAFDVQKWRMDELLTDAIALRYTSRIDPDELSPAAVGLDPPKAELTLQGRTDRDPFSLTLQLGRKSAAGRGYVRLEDDEHLYVVADDLHQTLVDKPLHELRATSLTSIPLDRAKRITLDRPDHRIELIRADGQWAITQPATGRADKTAVEDLVNGIRWASISDFIADRPESLEPYGLDEPSIVITVAMARPPALDDDAGEAADAEPQTCRLTIGGPADLAEKKFYATWQDQPVVFVVGKSSVDRLDRSAVDLRSKRLTDAAAGELNEIVLEPADGPTVHLIREQGVWAFGQPDLRYTIDPQQVEKLIAALLETEATDAVIVERPQLENPDVTVTLAEADRSERRIVQVDREEDTCRVLVVGETIANIVETDKLEPLFGDPLFFRNRTVLEVVPSDIAQVRVVRSGRYPATYTFTRAEADGNGLGAWELEGYDAKAFDRLLNQLAPLRATRWVAAPKMYSPEGVAIDLTMAEGDTRKLFIHPDAREATLAGVKLPFGVPQELVDAATAEMRDRTVLKIDVDDISAIVTRNITVHRDEQGEYSLEGSLAIDEAKAGALFDTVSGLQAGHWLDRPKPTGNPQPVVIHTADGRTLWLKLWKPNDRQTGDPIGQLDQGKPFTLTREAYDKMTTRPIEEPSK